MVRNSSRLRASRPCLLTPSKASSSMVDKGIVVGAQCIAPLAPLAREHVHCCPLDTMYSIESRGCIRGLRQSFLHRLRSNGRRECSVALFLHALHLQYRAYERQLSRSL